MICDRDCFNCKYDDCIIDHHQKEYDRQKYLKNRDKYIERAKKWAKDNKERHNENSKRYRANLIKNNPEKYQQMLEARRAYYRKRYADKKVVAND